MEKWGSIQRWCLGWRSECRRVIYRCDSCQWLCFHPSQVCQWDFMLNQRLGWMDDSDCCLLHQFKCFLWQRSTSELCQVRMRLSWGSDLSTAEAGFSTRLQKNTRNKSINAATHLVWLVVLCESEVSLKVLMLLQSCNFNTLNHVLLIFLFTRIRFMAKYICLVVIWCTTINSQRKKKH